MYIQTLTVKRIWLKEEDFEQHVCEIRLWFEKGAHHNEILDEKLVKVWFSNQEKICSKKDKCILLVATYHPIPQALNNRIRRNFNWLHAENKVKKLF